MIPNSTVPQDLQSPIRQALLERGARRPDHGNDVRFRCYFHDDRNPDCSWSWSKGSYHCHACGASGGYVAFCRAAGIQLGRSGARPPGKYAPPPPPPPGLQSPRKWGPSLPVRGPLRHPGNSRIPKGTEPTRTWNICDTAGRLFAVHCRFDLEDGSKTLSWWRNGSWKIRPYSPKNAPLYGSEDLHAYDRSRPVFVTEGEKARDALKALGVQCVATITGANNPRNGALPRTHAGHIWKSLDGFDVVFWPDNDAGGLAHMAESKRLLGTGRVLDVKSMNIPSKGDAVEWLESRAGIEAEALVTELEHLALATAPSATCDPSPPSPPSPPAQVENRQEPSGPPPPPGFKSSIPGSVNLGAKRAPFRFDRFKGTVLDEMDLPEPDPVIGNLITVGVTLLCGKPKQGKSMMAFNMVLSVAQGEKCFGSLETKQGPAVYLSLEDGMRRTRSRMRKMLNGAPVPEDLEFVFNSPRLDEGGLEGIEGLLEEVKPRLIVIDTLSRVRPLAKRDKNVYQNDYDSLIGLQQLATKHQTAIVVVYHTRKAESDDFLELVSGSFGLTGAVDAVMVLKRTRGEADATLHTTGRDVSEESDSGELAMSFDGHDLQWRVLGGREYSLTHERREILEYLKAVKPDCAWPKDIAEHLGKKPGTVKMLLAKLLEDGFIKRERKGYTASDDDPSLFDQEEKYDKVSDQQILEYLTKCLPESVFPSEIAEGLGKRDQTGSVKMLLAKLLRDEHVVKVETGAYTVEDYYGPLVA